MVKVNAKGKINNGKLVNRYIWIIDDSENTGGYLVIQSPTISFEGEGFDNWFVTLEEVEQFINYNKWEIEWFEKNELGDN
ncbi:hypothetical protein [Pelosinus fermentans]|uniref:Uncharacterized protein n=1 Tax=Pelosinus fermentans JBW45 TaxID=1192197 RepID=I9DC23_9FIRM|nr:hypothetical protein [Pelosinus fermentans]AJQ28764.1 hypothetical protein JBW_03423 [Pelosinus fermentans JBW45]